MKRKIKHYLYRIRSLPPGKVVRLISERFRGKMAEYWDRFWLKVKRSEIGSSVASLFSGNDTPVELFTQALKYRVTMSGTSGDITVKKIADYFRKRDEPRCLVDFMKKEEITRVLKTHYPELAGNIISEADRICDGIFSIMGSGDKRLERIDWHFDFKSGYRWNPKKYYKDIEIPYGKADIKVPWELSRFQHLSILGEAYCLSSIDIDKNSALAHSCLTSHHKAVTHSPVMNFAFNKYLKSAGAFSPSFPLSMSILIKICGIILPFLFRYTNNSTVFKPCICCPFS
ncbi:hypothetical protein ES705_15238 [subsurface metagenome]